MNILNKLIDIILHVDKYLDVIIAQYGGWVYAVLFLIVFCETGLVVAPFLPGDSLLFVAGAFAGKGLMNLWVMLGILFLAAVLGDTVNYWIGSYLGPKVFKEKHSRFFKQEHLEKTRAFYEKHGAKTIILARFIPIIRTFAPFVAGVGTMKYGRFLAYNIIGGALWVSIFGIGGYYFGGIPAVKENFTLVILLIIVVSFIPGIVEYFRHKKSKNI